MFIPNVPLNLETLELSNVTMDNHARSLKGGDDAEFRGVGKRGDSLRICFGVLRKDPYSSDLTRSRCHRDLPAVSVLFD